MCKEEEDSGDDEVIRGGTCRTDEGRMVGQEGRCKNTTVKD